MSKLGYEPYTLPHQCRCAICGDIGTILTSLPNVFADQPDPLARIHVELSRGHTSAAFAVVTAALNKRPLPNCVACDVVNDRRKDDSAIVPTETSGDAAYASSRADELAPRGEPPYTEVATCTHGYIRCMICKFPAP